MTYDPSVMIRRFLLCRHFHCHFFPRKRGCCDHDPAHEQPELHRFPLTSRTIYDETKVCPICCGSLDSLVIEDDGLQYGAYDISIRSPIALRCVSLQGSSPFSCTHHGMLRLQSPVNLSSPNDRSARYSILVDGGTDNPSHRCRRGRNRSDRPRLSRVVVGCYPRPTLFRTVATGIAGLSLGGDAVLCGIQGTGCRGLLPSTTRKLGTWPHIFKY